MKPGEFELDMGGVTKVLNDRPALDALKTLVADAVGEAQATGPRGAHAGRHQIDLLAVGEARETADGGEVDIDWPSHVWHLIEFGSSNNPPYRPVTRAVQNQGLRIIDRRGGAG